jgi:hypothetical protein
MWRLCGNIDRAVGYSLPEEDTLLRLLLRQFAEENVDGSEKIIFYHYQTTKVKN